MIALMDRPTSRLRRLLDRRFWRPMIIPPLQRREWYTALALFVLLSVLPSVTIFSVALFSATMHHRHFKLCMVLRLGVQHVAYRIQVCELSTSCFTTYFFFRHDMVPWQIFVALCRGILSD